MATVNKRIILVILFAFASVSVAMFFTFPSEYPKILNYERDFNIFDKYEISKNIENCRTHSWLLQPPVYQINDTHAFLMGPCKHVTLEQYYGDLETRIAEKTPKEGYDILPVYDDHPHDAVFSGDIAETICRFLDMPCPTDPKFKGRYDFAKQDGGFRYIYDNVHYQFRITNGDTVLVYDTSVDAFVTLPERIIEKRIPGGHPENNGFEIILDHENYPLGNSIKVSGKANAATNDYVILNVFDPNGQLMEAAKIPLDNHYRFVYKFDTYSSWEFGQYKIQLVDNNIIKNEKSFTIFSETFEDDFNIQFEETWGGPGNRHPSFLGYEIPNSCTEPMIKHLVKHSNIFEKNSDHLFLEFAGLPKGVGQADFDVCYDKLKEIREKN